MNLVGLQSIRESVQNVYSVDSKPIQSIERICLGPISMFRA